MKQWMKRHKVITGILSIVLAFGLYLYLFNVEDTKQRIEYVDKMLPKFEQQKTLYQKVNFLMNDLPEKGDSLYCDYYYDNSTPDEKVIDGVDVLKSIRLKNRDYKNRDYQVKGYKEIFITTLYTKKNTCDLLIAKTYGEYYCLTIDNNWKVLKCDDPKGKPIPKEEQEKLIALGKKNVNLMFRTVKDNLERMQRTRPIFFWEYLEDDEN